MITRLIKLLTKIKKLTDDLRNLLQRWKINNYINENTYKILLTAHGVLSRVYCAPEIYKKGYPLRIF